jgi:membrane protein implicated in regulation of membrane protease activity
MWQVWLIIAGLFFVGEIATVGFLIFWFGIGALIAMIVSFFTSNIIIQTTIFVISSTILIFATKPFVKKFADVKKTNTNVYSIIGKKALVIKTIDPIHSVGQIKINGEVWTAESENNQVIDEGSEVEILEIKGVKAIVKPIHVLNKI